jgi:hypothetical protein
MELELFGSSHASLLTDCSEQSGDLYSGLLGLAAHCVSVTVSSQE